MKIFKRLLLGLIVIVFLAVAAGLLILLIIPETDLIRDKVQERLRAATGQDVNIGALKISASFKGLVSLDFRDVSVNSPSGDKLMSVDRISLVPELLPLLRKELSIQSIAIQGFKGSIIRYPDGTIQTMVPPIPVSRDDQQTIPDVTGGPKIQSDSSSPSKRLDASADLRLTVDSVYLENSQIGLIDKYVDSTGERTIYFSNVNGALLGKEGKKDFSINLSSVVSDQKGQVGKITVSGSAAASPHLSALTHLDITISSDSLNLRPIAVYLRDRAGVIERLGNAITRVQFQWNNNKSCHISAGLEFVDPKSLKIHSNIIASPDLKKIEEAKASVSSDSLPLRLFSELIPEQVPFDWSTGSLQANLEGQWRGPDDWMLRGKLGLENVSPTGVLKKIVPDVKISAKGELKPDLLTLDQLEVVSGEPFAVLSGTIGKPLSSDRILDLKGDFSFQSKWFQELGIGLPSNLKIKGNIPTKGTIKGQFLNPLLDLTADVTALGIESPPYVEKVSGSKGNIKIKGKFLSLKDQRLSEPVHLSAELSGIRLGTPPHAAIDRAIVQFESKILLKPKDVDLREASLRFRRSFDSKELLSAHGNLINWGGRDMKIDGKAVINLDQELLAMTGIEKKDITISGNIPLKAKFSGTLAGVSWTIEAPLNQTEITSDQFFKKPAGTAASFKASGKWAKDSIELREGQLNLPRSVIHVRGEIRDPSGQFGSFTIETKKMDLRELSRFVIPLAEMRISGPVDATLKVKKSDGKMLASGIVHLQGVDVHPDKAGFGIEKIRGTVEPSGTSVKIAELSGRLTGTVEAPFLIRGSLDNVNDINLISGHLKVQSGPGSIKGSQLQNILKNIQLVNALLNPGGIQRKNDNLEFDSILANINVRAGVARTEDLSLRGPEISSGVIGSYHLASSDLDLLVGLRTMTNLGAAVGKVPAVQKLLKQNEELLKITGLDKELKRLGIDASSSKSDEQGNAKLSPITLILKIRGPAASPNVTPVLETNLDKGAASRLKSLME